MSSATSPTKGDLRVDPDSARSALRGVEPSFYRLDGQKEYVPVFPVRLLMRNGKAYDRAFIITDRVNYRGFWPHRRKAIRLSDIQLIEPSPLRLPAPIASLLSQMEENSMGYLIFEVTFAGGEKRVAVVGNGPFIDYLEMEGTPLTAKIQALDFDRRGRGSSWPRATITEYEMAPFCAVSQEVLPAVEREDPVWGERFDESAWDCSGGRPKRFL